MKYCSFDKNCVEGGSPHRKAPIITWQHRKAQIAGVEQQNHNCMPAGPVTQYLFSLSSYGMY
jgi:hypothetical protein